MVSDSPYLVEAEYIFADCSGRNRFFLQFGGGPYIFASYYGFMHNLRRIGFAGPYVLLGLVVLFQALPTLASDLSTTGHFEVAAMVSDCY